MIRCRLTARGEAVVLPRQDGPTLWALGCYGSKPGEPVCRLSLVEAAHLLHAGRITLTDEAGLGVSSGQLDGLLTDRQRCLLRAYSELRRRWVVRSGINYGTDFVLYRASPDTEHAEYAVLVFGEQSDSDRAVSWRTLLGINRSCVGAKKRLLVATVGTDVRLTEVGRWIPEAER